MQAQLASEDIRDATTALYTTRDLTIYLATTGSDLSGDGSIGNPYATWDKALEQVPLYIEHRVRIKASAGTYHSFPRHLRHNCGRHGLLSMEGKDTPTTVAGPFTVGTATLVGKDPAYPAGWDLTVAGAAWVPDCWYGKFIRFTSGANEGVCAAIGYNSSDTISINAVFFDVIATDTFIVVDPSVRIEMEFAPIFSIRGDGVSGRTFSQFIVANIEFYVPDMSYGDYLHWYPFTFNEDCCALMGLVKFVGIDTYLGLWDQKAGQINLSAYEYLDPWVPILEDDRLVMYYDSPTFVYWGTVGSAQMLGSATPPVVAGCWVGFTGCDANERGVQFNKMVCRNGMYLDALKAEAYGCTFGYVNADHGSAFYMAACRYRSGTLGVNAIRVDDRSLGDLDSCWVDSSALDAILVTDCSDCIIYTTGGTKLSIAGYGMKIGALCRVKKEGTTDLEGTSGKVRLDQNNTTVNWPGAKAGSTDGLGSFIAG